MHHETAGDTNLASTEAQRPARFTRVIRRTHLYLGLFLAPWMLMYALSTAVMNHRELVASWHSSKTPALVQEQELAYSRGLPADATPQQMGLQILRDIGLEGTHRVSGGKDGKPLVIERQHPLALRRITFDSKQSKIVIQREEFRSATILERLHRRRGYQNPYTLEDAWAFSVDLTVLTMVFWGLSGIWIWWELRAARIWGIISGGLGLAFFAVFLVLL